NDSSNRLGRLVPVRVGDVPDNRIPVMLQPDRLRFIDVGHEPSEAQLELLINELARALGRDMPLVIPAAVSAIASDEFADFTELAGGHDRVKVARLTALCQAAGMPRDDLWGQLARRYGATAGEFTPYADEADNAHRLIDVTRGALRVVNEKRVRA